MHEQLKTFFSKYNCNQVDIDTLTKMLLEDMELGLKGDVSAHQKMIVVHGLLPVKKPVNEDVIVIDAGGTNFRTSLIHFDSDGKVSISKENKTSMPAIDKELSKEEFYDAIAAKLDYLKDSATKIGFCFSYAMEMNEDNDGKVLAFAKEVKAPEVVGTFVGENLKKSLLNHGWKTAPKITMLNDTTAALLSGACSIKDKEYSSYVGFILGTGINNAYIESEPIAKLTAQKQKEHIVVCEAGMYNKFEQSDFDKMLDSASTEPGTSLLEKMCSGAYMGPIVYNIIKTACKDKLFSDKFCAAVETINNIYTWDISDFYRDEKSVLKELSAKGTADDSQILKEILDFIVQRTANIATGIIASSVIKSKKGFDKEKPVCIVCNGSTYYKCDSVAKKTEAQLNNYLGSKGIYFETKCIENDITLGTAVSAVIA